MVSALPAAGHVLGSKGELAISWTAVARKRDAMKTRLFPLAWRQSESSQFLIFTASFSLEFFSPKTVFHRTILTG